MHLDFRPSWMNEELDLFGDNVARFLDNEVAPQDEAARKQGHVGAAPASWVSCAWTYPNNSAAVAATFAMKRYSTTRWHAAA
jgi:hypothetical protein